MTDLSKLRAKIAALRAKTPERGCTEAEALAAAEKAAALMEEHGLSEADVDRGLHEALGVDLGSRRSPLDGLWLAVAKFSDCYGYLDRSSGRLRFVYFGREADVLVAEYVHEVIRHAADTAIAAFRESASYRRRRKPSTRRQALKAFLEGFTRSVAVKLFDGLWKRKGGSSTGIALIKHNQATLQAELERRGLSFKPSRSIAASRGEFRDEARARGIYAGRDVAINAGVSGAAAQPVGGLLE